MKFRRVIFLLYSIFIKYNLVYSLDVLQLQELTTGLHNLSNIKILEKNVENKPVEISQYKFGFTNTVISIDNIVNELDQRASCDARYWNNKLENACKCCLIQNAPKLDIGKKPSEILKICLDKNQCNNGVIQELLNQEKIESKDNEEKIRELIYHIYNKSVIVKEVFPHDIKFNADGTLNEDTVKELLVEAYQENKLKDSNFKDTSCLSIKNIFTKKAGGESAQLFSITSNCLNKPTDYILKEMKPGLEEVKNLEKVNLISNLAPYKYPKIIPGFPSIILPIAYMSYNYSGKNHYLSLMLKAPGVRLSSLVGRYKNHTIDKADVEQAYYQTGFAFSKFHQIAFNQGDAHEGNIFYDKSTNQIIFIDNEAFFIGWNSFIDIEMFIFPTFWFLLHPLKKIDATFLNNWILLSIGSFLKGYIEAYKIDERKQLLEKLIRQFNDEQSYSDKYLYLFYINKKGIFDKIFEELKKIYNA